MSPIEQTTRGSNRDYRRSDDGGGASGGGSDEGDDGGDVVDGARLTRPTSGAVRLRSVNSSTSETAQNGERREGERANGWKFLLNACSLCVRRQHRGEGAPG